MDMQPVYRPLAAVVGLLAMLAGAGLLVDGLLPSRSNGPNPSWAEVIFGLVVTMSGAAIRLKAGKVRSECWSQQG